MKKLSVILTFLFMLGTTQGQIIQDMTPVEGTCWEYYTDSDGDTSFSPMDCCEYEILVPVFLPMTTIWVTMTYTGSCPP